MKDEIKENCSNCEYNRQCFIKKQLGAVECQKDKDYITNLQEKLEVSETNEETYRLEMLDITKCLGLDEDTIFDEVKEKATNLQEENKKLKQWDCNKDSRNSRQRVELKKLMKENERLTAESTEWESKFYDLQEENERLNKEVAKLHIIQEEYGNHIENTHIIDDYQKTYFMSNKWLIELKNGKFVYIDDLNDKYEDYKSRSCEIEAEHTLNNEKCLISINHSKKVKNILNGGDDNE